MQGEPNMSPSANEEVSMDSQDSPTPTVVSSSMPVLRLSVDVGARFSHTLLRTGFTAARDVHGEWKQRVREVFDLVESSQKGFTSLLRRLNGYVDTVIEETLGSAEELLGGVVRTVETSASEAADAAARTSGAWIGKAPERAA